MTMDKRFVVYIVARYWLFSTYFFVASFDYLLSKSSACDTISRPTSPLLPFFFFLTLYVCSGDCHSAKQKVHAVSFPAGLDSISL